MIPTSRTTVWLAIALVCALASACDRSAQDGKMAPRTTSPTQGSDSSTPVSDDASPDAPPADPFWDGLTRESIQLGQTLLVVKGSKGLAGCTYLNVDTFERGGEACVILPAADFDGMLDAKVTAATSAAEALGVQVGMPGREALELLR